jgi:hypothetical protein
MSIFSFTKNLWDRVCDLLVDKSLSQHAQQLSQEWKACLRDVRDQHQQLKQSVHLMSHTLSSLDGYVWNKDLIGRYLYANLPMCLDILLPYMRVDQNPAESILNKTDSEILVEHGQAETLYSTFCETLPIADRYTMNHRGSYQFIEVGKVQGIPKVLFSVRGPTYNPEDGNLCGIAGMAIESPFPFESGDIEQMVKTAETTQLHPDVYLLGCRG